MTTQRLIRKNLAGEEDLLLGEGTVVQTRNGSDYTITKNRNIQPVNSITELNALDPDKFKKAMLFDGTSAVTYSYNAGTGLWEVANTGVMGFDILADAVASTAVHEGAVVELKERTAGNGGGALWDVVLSSTVTENAYNIVQCTGVATLSLVLRVGSVLFIKQFGAKPDDSTDAFSSIQAALDLASTAGGGRVFGSGETFRIDIDTSVADHGLVIPDDVTFDLNGAILNLHCTGNVYGIRIKNRSHIVNGTVNVVTVSGSGLQTVWQTPISIGVANGVSTVGSISEFEGVTGWSVRGLKLSSTKNGSVGVQIIGAANNGVIEQVEVAASSVMNGGIHLDWGTVGDINMSDIPGTRTLFDAGTAYTTHPHNIEISNIKVGALTKASVTTGIRLSGSNDVHAHDFEIAETTLDGVFNTAGDGGYEFAQSTVKPFRHQNIRFVRGSMLKSGTGRGVFCDMFADDIQSAVDSVAYIPLLNTIQETNILFDQVTTRSDGGAGASHGFRFQKMIGGTARDCVASGYLIGAVAEESLQRFKFEGGDYHDNRQEGILIEHAVSQPQFVSVIGAMARGNGTDAGAGNIAGIKVGNSQHTMIIGCKLGNSEETSQEYGIQVTGDPDNVTLLNNHTFDLSGTLAAYPISSTTGYNVLKEFRGNTISSSVTSAVSGVNIIPYATVSTPSGQVTHFIGARAGLSASITPQAGSWLVGDTIYYDVPLASDFEGTLCISAGSPGTWKRFGATEA